MTYSSKKEKKRKPQREIGKLLPYECVLYFCFHRWRQTGVLQRFFFFKNICNSRNSLTSCSIERIPKLPESTDSAIFSSTAPQRRRLVERRESEGRKSSTENRTFYLFSFDLLGFFFGVFFSFSCFLCYLLSTECGPCLGLL